MINLKSYAAKTDQGPFLQINEDDHSIDLSNRLFMVFDGFGGTGIGDRCVAKLKEMISKFYTKVGGDADSTLPFFYSHKYLIEGNALINSMHYAHNILKKENMAKEMAQRGGASAVAVAFSENILTFAATGSCASYLYRRGTLSPITMPDTLRSISSDGHQIHFYTAPMSGFGLFDDLHLSISELRILPDDMIVMMTDGAYSRISFDELKFQLEKGDLNGNQKIQDIFDISNSRGNLDNQTMMILSF